MTGVLVLGANGLLGSHLCAFNPEFIPICRDECDITNEEDTTRLFKKYNPEWIINCAGVVPKAQVDTSSFCLTNALAPRILSAKCENENTHLIHISTNCVFSGRTSVKNEFSIPDPKDIYGISKYLGESVCQKSTITIRTSFVGFPDPKGHSLLGWFSRQTEPVFGYEKVMWNGVTTLELSHKINTILQEGLASGLYHLVSTPISKYDLLVITNVVFGWNKEIFPNDVLVEDRTLDTIYPDFRVKKSHKDMLEELEEKWQTIQK